MAGDFLWGIKVLFDPTIKAGNYSAGAAGNAEAYADLVKVFTVMGKLQAGLSTGAWPDTSSATGKALAAAGVPSRSALLLLGLMSGLPTQSAHFDSISGPEGALKLTFPLAVSPALAVLENGTNAAALCEPDAYGTLTAKLTPAVLNPARASVPKSSSWYRRPIFLPAKLSLMYSPMIFASMMYEGKTV